MSGYRQQGFNPNASDMPEPPTWVQRIGIACLFVGAVIIFAYLGGRFGLIPTWIDSPILGTIVIIMAGPLMGAGARRVELSPETLKRRRILLIAVALGALVLGAAIAIFLNTQGA